MYQNPSPMGPEILHTTGAGEGGQSFRGNFSLQRWRCINPVSKKKKVFSPDFLLLGYLSLFSVRDLLLDLLF